MEQRTKEIQKKEQIAYLIGRLSLCSGYDEQTRQEIINEYNTSFDVKEEMVRHDP